MKNFNEIEFKNPPSEYSPAPFWFLNGDLDENELYRQLCEMKAKGVDECVLHSRKGCTVEYLSEKWFEKIGFILKSCEEIGLKAWIYDEDNWPSGYAGGRVVAKNKSFAAKCLSVEKIYPVLGEYIEVETKPDSEIECVIAVHSDSYFLDITDYEKKTNKPWRSETLCWEVFVFRKEFCKHKPAYSPEPYVDLLNPAATKTFVELTHAEYKKRFPREWKSVIKGFFTDEPGFYQNYLEQCANLNTVIWTDDFAERFIEKFGYDIRPHLCCLWQDMGEVSIKTRCDYYKAVADFYVESYFDVITDFLKPDGLMNIGHLHREDKIETLVQTESDFFTVMRSLSISGIDCIERNVNRITEKLGSSVAHVSGQKVCFSETFGGFGWSLGLQEMKTLTDMQYVQGVNMLVPHAFFYSTDGIRKTESPPSLFFQNGYWKHFKLYADYVKRLSYFGRSGEFRADVAFYFPVKTAWAKYRPLYRYDLYKLDEQLVTLREELLNSMLDFDFTDDKTVIDSTVKNGKLICGENNGYGAVVLPEISVMPFEVLSKLDKFAAGGGIVLAFGKFEPTDEEGFVSPEYKAALNSLKSSSGFIKGETHLEKEAVAALRSRTEQRVFALSGGVYSCRRDDENSEMYFLINTENMEKTVYIKADKNESCVLYDPENGNGEKVYKTEKDGLKSFEIRLKPLGSVIAAIKEGSCDSSAEALQGQKGYDEEIDLSQNWQAEVSGEEKAVKKPTFGECGLKGYSGEVAFKKAFGLKSAVDAAVLKIEKADEYVEVRINGEDAGVRLWAPFEFDLSGKIKEGENLLEITVGSSENNRMTGANDDAGLFGKISVCLKTSR